MPTGRKQEPWPADLGLSWGSCWEGLGLWCPPHPEELPAGWPAGRMGNSSVPLWGSLRSLASPCPATGVETAP